MRRSYGIRLKGVQKVEDRKLSQRSTEGRTEEDRRWSQRSTESRTEGDRRWGQR